MNSHDYFVFECILAVVLVLMLVATIVFAPPAGAEPLMEVRIVQARGGLNVRAAPDLAASTVYLLDNCQTVVVVGKLDGWALVAGNAAPYAEIGWVWAEYLK